MKDNADKDIIIDGEITKKEKMNYKIIGKYIKDLNFQIPNQKLFYYQKICQITELKLI